MLAVPPRLVGHRHVHLLAGRNAKDLALRVKHLVAERRRTMEERGRLAEAAGDLGCGGVRLVACLANHAYDRALDLVARADTYGNGMLRQCVLCLSLEVTVALRARLLCTRLVLATSRRERIGRQLED